MNPASEQDEWQRIGVFDFETWTDENNRHHVMAVGVSYESNKPEEAKEGCWNEAFFFNTEMRHKKHGIVREGVYKKVYVPESVRPKYTSKPKNFKSRFDPAAPRHVRRNRDQNEQEEEERAVIGGGEDENYSAEDMMRMASQFICGEAAEADPSSDEEEEQVANAEEEDDPEEAGPSTGKGKKRADSWMRFLREDYEDSDAEEDEMQSSSLDEFVEFLCNPDGSFFGYTFLAHNLGRFDGILLLRTLLRKRVQVCPVFDGSRLVVLRLPELKISFLDSLRYIPLRLKDFPSRFPTAMDGVRKGEFPHAFNKPKNFFYRGKIPPIRYFLDSFATKDKSKEVRRYHRKFRRSGKTWDFQREIYLYLRDDVRVLRAGVVALIIELLDFQKDFERKAELPLHPFSRPYVTASAFAHGLFRFYSLSKDTIYLVSNQTGARKTSTKELEWLNYQMWRTQTYIRTGFNHSQGQKRIKNFYLDGYSRGNAQSEEEQDRAGCSQEIAYEFNGKMWDFLHLNFLLFIKCHENMSLAIC